MRVLFWVSGLLPSIGGVQMLAADLLPALEERGYRHVVVTEDRSNECSTVTHYGKIPIHRFPFWNSWNNIDRLTQVRQQIAELKRAFSPDLIHIYAVNPGNFFHHLTAHVHPAPLLVTLHGKWTPCAARTLQNATWVVGCSEALLKAGEKLVPGILRRSSVIHNGRRLPSFEPSRLSADSPRLLCVGRLAPEKGFDIALAAFVKVRNQFSRAKLIIAGDGPEKERLRRQIVELNLVDQVELMGWVTQDEVVALLDSATLVVIPSRREGLPLIAVEAALMARPVVGTWVGGLPEAVVHGQTGLLVQEENSDALAQAIAFLLDHPETANQMGQTGRNRASNKFRLDHYIDAYDELYQKLIVTNNSRSAVAFRPRMVVSP